jgi:hypothetical protein
MWRTLRRPPSFGDHRNLVTSIIGRTAGFILHFQTDAVRFLQHTPQQALELRLIVATERAQQLGCLLVAALAPARELLLAAPRERHDDDPFIVVLSLAGQQAVALEALARAGYGAGREAQSAGKLAHAHAAVVAELAKQPELLGRELAAPHGAGLTVEQAAEMQQVVGEGAVETLGQHHTRVVHQFCLNIE